MKRLSSITAAILMAATLGCGPQEVNERSDSDFAEQSGDLADGALGLAALSKCSGLEGDEPGEDEEVSLSEANELCQSLEESGFLAGLIDEAEDSEI